MINIIQIKKSYSFFYHRFQNFFVNSLLDGLKFVIIFVVCYVVMAEQYEFLLMFLYVVNMVFYGYLVQNIYVVVLDLIVSQSLYYSQIFFLGPLPSWLYFRGVQKLREGESIMLENYIQIFYIMVQIVFIVYLRKNQIPFKYQFQLFVRRQSPYLKQQIKQKQREQKINEKKLQLLNLDKQYQQNNFSINYQEQYFQDFDFGKTQEKLLVQKDGLN